METWRSAPGMGLTAPCSSSRSSLGHAGPCKAEAPGQAREGGTEGERDEGRERSMFVLN